MRQTTSNLAEKNQSINDARMIFAEIKLHKKLKEQKQN